MVTRILTRRELEALETLAGALEARGLVEERELLLGVLRASAEPGELSVSEAAQLARKCRQTIRNWIRAGRLPARADETNHYYVRVEALLPLLGSPRGREVCDGGGRWRRSS